MLINDLKKTSTLPKSIQRKNIWLGKFKKNDLHLNLNRQVAFEQPGGLPGTVVAEFNH